MREHYATGICLEDHPAVGQGGRRGRLDGSNGLGFPRLTTSHDAAPRGVWSSALLQRVGGQWTEISRAAKRAQTPQATLELKGISDTATESSSPLFESLAPFHCSPVSSYVSLLEFTFERRAPAKGQ